MHQESLHTLLRDLLERLDSLLQDDCEITQHIELAELIHAAWMRLKNWESDIKSEDKGTLEKLPELSPQTAEIVRSRMITLSRAIAEVESKVGSAETGLLEILTIPIKDIFRATVNISRLTRNLIRLVDPDDLSTYINAVADSQRNQELGATTEATSSSRTQSPYLFKRSRKVETAQNQSHVRDIGKMAEPIAIDSTVPALATFAFNSSVSLYQTIRSFRSNKKEIRELEEELKALSNVIQSLRELVSTNDVQFEHIRPPLLGCGKACQDFGEEIANYTPHSRESKISFRDWAKLQYMGDDIVGFKNLLAGFKSTISIAIGDVNLCTAATSVNAIQEFKEMLENTMTNLQEHVQNLADKSEAHRIRESSAKDEYVAERIQLSEEFDTLEQCLAICARASEHIDEVRTNVYKNVPAAEDPHQFVVPTFGDLISVRQVTAGIRGTQLEGQMPDDVLQHLARSRGVDLSSRSGTAKSVEEQAKGTIKFED